MGPKQRPIKKKRIVTYTEANLYKAMRDFRDKKKSIRQISLQYGIPKSTILDKLSGRRPSGIQKPGPGPVLGVNGEKKVIEWLLKITKCGFPVKVDELLDTVQKIIRNEKIKNTFKDDRPGRKWLEKFMFRNGEISLISGEDIDKASGLVTEESVRSWYEELEEYLDSVQQKDILSDPERIFNGDETVFALCPKTGNVLGAKNHIESSNDKLNITVLLTFNAVGDLSPPCVVFPYIRPPKTVVNSMPRKWYLGKSKSGLMTTEVFFEYVTKKFNNWIEQKNIKKPVLLLVDGEKTHMSLTLSTACEQMQIILYALPPNPTHILQPPEVSVFPVRAYWKSIESNFVSNPENVKSTITKFNFCTHLNEVLSHPNLAENMRKEFEQTGLYPFDANSLNYTKCLKNTHNITRSDIETFEKVLTLLRPKYEKKKIFIQSLFNELNTLKNYFPVEQDVGENSIGKCEDPSNAEND